MSSSVTDPTSEHASTVESAPTASPNNKGKAKAPATDQPMDEDDEEDEEEQEEDDDDDDDDDEEEEEETFDEIDPSAIVTRRTRGARVDYTSNEALEKAGLKPGDGEDDEDEDIDMQ